MVRVVDEGKGSRAVKGKTTFGKYRKIQCILGEGGVCKNKWNVTIWGGSTGAIHKHIASVSDLHHQNAMKILHSESSNQVQTEDGGFVQVMGFDELFEHHCRATSCLIHTSMSENTLHNEKFLEYIQGFEIRAKAPSKLTVARLSKIMFELIVQEQNKMIEKLKNEYKERECLGLQLDGWTSENDVSFYVVNITRIDVVDGDVVLVDEVLDFCVFPVASHTAANIKKWLLDLLDKRGIFLSMITLVTADGAANGQAAINSIPELQDKVCIHFDCVVWYHSMCVAYIHIYIHSCMYAFMHAYMCTCIHACIHTYIRKYIHACIHAYIHTYLHTYIYILSDADTCVRKSQPTEGC
jgi:hypothetical protein